MNIKGFIKIPFRIINYVHYHLVSKSLIRHYSISVDNSIELLSLESKSNICIADIGMMSLIEDTLFSELKGEQEYDKRYFELIGNQGVVCILVMVDKKIIHYSFLFTDLKLSPLAKLIPKKIASLSNQNSAFLGPAYTLPEFRGYLLPEVLSYALNYLIQSTEIKKLLVCVFIKNPGAENFYKRLGFYQQNL